MKKPWLIKRNSFIDVAFSIWKGGEQVEKNTLDWKNLIVDINDIILGSEKFYAHTRMVLGKEDEGKKEKIEAELLKEHIDRCIYYFEQIYLQKKLEDIIINFCNELMGDISLEGKRMFNEMFINTIAFHDLGKINPAFQKVKMHNGIHKIQDISCLDGANHSLLSSAIFIDYYSEQIRLHSVSRNEMEKLHVIMLADAYVISRHHSDLISFYSFLDDFCEGKLYYIFEGFRNNEFSSIYCGMFYEGKPELINLDRKNRKCLENFYQAGCNELSLYTYIRLLFSLLVSCDYYATTEFENGMKICDFGNIADIDKLNNMYEQSDLIQEIRKLYSKNMADDGKDINYLRRSMFYEAEEHLGKDKERGIYFIEAPTGGGKSNIAMNCSFKLLNDRIRKIFYVYPFNTLVEQNMISLKRIFGNTDIEQEIAVINSITPIKMKVNSEKQLLDETDEKFYQKALLDRQFLNYPFILTTHVNLFDVMFGKEKGAAISFYQLAGSVIVLDEIQSYRNTIWTEIILFLVTYSRLLNIRFIIMSATLPRLDVLTGNKEKAVNLIQNRNRYFEDSRFKKRVDVSYELLDEVEKAGTDKLYSHIWSHAQKGKKILVEFIRKKSAEEFYQKMKEMKNEDFLVLCMTGDDNMIDRQRIIKQITEERNDKGIVLIATQVVEAGIDIDMDIGYKDISKLDSDEQFLGRINRNFKRDGKTFFFDLDDEKAIYGKDYRVNYELTLRTNEMRAILNEKDFPSYYKNVLDLLKRNQNEKLNEKGICHFLEQEVKKIDFTAVSKRMQLIDDTQWDISVYLARNIIDIKGNVLDGMEIWNEYKELLANQSLEYAKKQILLSKVRSKMNYFIYRINKNSNINYSDQIGGLYCIEDGEQYFENGRLDKTKFMSQGAIFIDI